MPAPTALLQQPLEAAPPSDLAQNNVVDQDLGDDFTLEGINDMPESADVIQPASAAAEQGMDIDEEGKPRFAPVQNIVCVFYAHTDPRSEASSRANSRLRDLKLTI